MKRMLLCSTSMVAPSRRTSLATKLLKMMARMEDLPAPERPMSSTLRCFWRLPRSGVLMPGTCLRNAGCWQLSSLCKMLWNYGIEVMMDSRSRVMSPWTHRGVVHELCRCLMQTSL